jgi:4-hydroxythreonine-4-phosphate dehydrogenase
MSQPEPPSLAITIGDINGVGPEVMVKALMRPELRRSCRPVIVGSGPLLQRYLQEFPVGDASVGEGDLKVAGARFPIIEIESDATFTPGQATAGAGKLAGEAISRGVELVTSGAADALLTMPISKTGLHAGGFDYPGHTEMIAAITGGDPLMVLLTEGMRVALATIHIPIAAVAGSITGDLVEERLHQIYLMLRRDFSVAVPRIAVLGLNPHAGESGAIGHEEIDTIIPALDRVRGEGISAEGPFPADGFFARFTPGEYDALLAMYHDQGLIPLKFFARGGGVNFTANLPVVRTSPDHGTAYAIVGRGIADHTSTVEAALLAAQIWRNRQAIGRL